jgi:hypothetical protein
MLKIGKMVNDLALVSQINKKNNLYYMIIIKVFS